MAVQLSPGVNFSEIDLTTIVPAASSTDTAFSGVFRWGPVGEIVLVDSAVSLVNRFGKPTNFNAETFFTAYNFLSYSNRLYISRAANGTGATPNVSVSATSGSPNVAMTNTSGLVAGMYVTQTSNTSVFTPSTRLKITSVTNSTSVVLSQNAAATNSAVTLYFGRPETAYNALAVEEGGIVANLVHQIIPNENVYNSKDGALDTDVLYLAKYPGDMGNSLRVAVCDTANAYNSNVTSAVDFSYSIGANSSAAQFSGTSNAAGITVGNSFVTGDKILVGNASIGYQYLEIAAVSVNTSYSGNTLVTISFHDTFRLHTAYSSNVIQRYWEFHNLVDNAPGQSPYVLANGNTSANDELHIVVVDDGGKFTGTPGTVLEVYQGLSRASDAKSADNTVNYYKDVLNINSNYIWWGNDRSTAISNTAVNITSSTSTKPGSFQMALGSDGYDEANSSVFSVVANGYDLFKSPENIDISLVLQGKPTGGAGSTYQLANYLIENIAEVRKDCIVLISPDKSNVLNNTGDETLDLIAWRKNVTSSSYAVIDSGYKYQYDRYNDIYRWVPMNGDIAGLCARTDYTNDPWYSPAGFNRGQIRGVVKLAFNPTQTQRDIIYPYGINPVVTFPGEGTCLFGDRTAQTKSSAFDRINVRRLFIVLEKAIATAAQYSLFEFNDAFTRAQFKSMVEPFLRDVQARRGITDFKVVCNESNNTAAVIDSNRFVADIYIKPNRSINYIQLNFIATRTGVSFDEVGA